MRNNLTTFDTRLEALKRKVESNELNHRGEERTFTPTRQQHYNIDVSYFMIVTSLAIAFILLVIISII